LLRVVGAGLGRTGTASLKLALEQLLQAPCYHMLELLDHPADIPLWHAAVEGNPPDWHAVFAGYRATVDWPAASFWPELSEAFPEALVLLSLREPESWWQSVHETIFSPVNLSRARPGGWHAMWNDLIVARFTDRLQDKDACIAAFNYHNEEVRKRVPRSRLLEWRVSDSWEPLCRELDLPVPDRPFPHANSKGEFVETFIRGA
jgi:hypothetical protein